MLILSFIAFYGLACLRPPDTKLIAQYSCGISITLNSYGKRLLIARGKIWAELCQAQNKLTIVLVTFSYTGTRT